MGDIFGWGLGKQGEIGRESTQKNGAQINPVQITKQSVIQEVACGAYFSVALTKDGRVLAWGKNQNNRTGHGGEIEQVPRPRIVQSLSCWNIVKIACGADHCIALSTDGHLIGWGKGTRGQLGRQSILAQNNPSLIDLEGSSLQSLTVDAIACGAQVSYACSGGRLFSWGTNAHKQLGRPCSELYDAVPALVKIPPVRKMSAGIVHAAAITIDADLFTWGSNRRGELGLGSSARYHVKPTKVAFGTPVQVQDVSCGLSEAHPHTLCITHDQEVGVRVWSWGDSYKDKLGIEDLKADIGTPMEIESLRGLHTTAVRAAGIHSLALVHGAVYTWGCGSDGRLGHPEFEGHRYLYKESIPKKIESLADTGKQCISICGSYYHTLALMCDPDGSC